MHIHIPRVDFPVPPPNFNHLKAMTDQTGILQHAKFLVPDREHGYCLDDNARALLVATLGRKIFPDYDFFDQLIPIYLGFLLHAFDTKQGRFRNFLSYDRRWTETSGSEDSHGRAVWSLGVTAGRDLRLFWNSPAHQLFFQGLRSVENFRALRALSFSILGITAYLDATTDHHGVFNTLQMLAGKLKNAYNANASEGWPWPETSVTYDNARIPEAMLSAGRTIGDKELIGFGLTALQWLMTIQRNRGGTSLFSPIGNKGWYQKSSNVPQFDQQPLEAVAMMEACRRAFEHTKDSKWLRFRETCFSWYLGNNELGYSVFDPVSGGCKDGLCANGMNQNQGAESTLSWLLAFLSVYQR